MQRKFKPFAVAKVTVKNHNTGKVFHSPSPMKVFVDTGASITIVPTEALPILKHETGDLETVPTKVQTVNGVKDAIAIKNTTICLDDVCYRGDVLVSDGIAGDVLVGSDLLSSRKCKVDFWKKEITCQGKKIPFSME